MKTTLFLFATLFITTITFSQTSKKGYDHYSAQSASKKMNKGELIDAMAKDGNISKRAARTGRNPQTGKEIKSVRNTNGLPTGKRTYKTNAKTNQGNQKAEARHNWIQGRSRSNISKPASEQTTSKKFRIRPIDGKNEAGQSDNHNLRKRPGRSQGDPIPGIGITKEQGFAQDGDDLHIRKRPGRSQGDPIPGMDITTEKGVGSTKSKNLRKRPGRTTYKNAKSTSIINPPIPTKATDYNSSRSNKSF